MNVFVEIINQLSDNYSYLIFDSSTSSSIVIDPAEHEKIIPFLKKKNLKLDYILITHHHSDHTSGVKGLMEEYPNANIFSPSELLNLKINKISNGNKIKTSFNEFHVLSAPGHTLDHIILCDKKNNLLFVGDVLFRLGCGRIFEGTIEQMHTSLNKIFDLSDNMKVFCGHEYTLNNLKFLEHIFFQNNILQNVKKQIVKELSSVKKSIPFLLGDEKKYNPFLNPECKISYEFKKINNYSNLEFFRYLRDKKDNF